MLNIRISSPDSPSSFAAMTNVLGNAGMSVSRLETLDRSEGLVVHDLCVDAATPSSDAVRDTLEALPGVVVEAIRPAADTPDSTAPTRLATELADAGTNSIGHLVSGLPTALWASWALAVRRADRKALVIARSYGAPPVTALTAPWLPLEQARRLEPAPWMPLTWRLRAGSGLLALAAAPLEQPDQAVVVARSWGARFCPQELEQLGILARAAGVSST